MTDPFVTLGVERRFDLDLSVLEKRHRDLSRALHPDKFTQTNASERRASLEKAAEVNAAWRVVRDPIKRAEALFELAGIKVGETNEPKPGTDFLMDMLEMREELGEARAKKKLDEVTRLGGRIEARQKIAFDKLAAGFAAGGDLAPIVPIMGELRFYKRFLDEVSAIEDEAAEIAAGAQP